MYRVVSAVTTPRLWTARNQGLSPGPGRTGQGNTPKRTTPPARPPPAPAGVTIGHSALWTAPMRGQSLGQWPRGSWPDARRRPPAPAPAPTSRGGLRRLDLEDLELERAARGRHLDDLALLLPHDRL